MMELMPTKQSVIAGTALQVNNAMVSLFGCLYFWFISKYWVWIELFACLTGVIAALAVLFLFPESPKFLITKKRYGEARAAISLIASFNKQKGFNHQFDREVAENEFFKGSFTGRLNATEAGTATELGE
jgi:hypothetical protein